MPELYCSISILARHLCTSFVDPQVVLALVSCTLIALDRSPGPIGVGEVARRIIAKAVLSIISPDIQVLCNSVLANPLVWRLQFTGVEAAIHCMRSVVTTTLKAFTC